MDPEPHYVPYRPSLRRMASRCGAVWMGVGAVLLLLAASPYLLGPRTVELELILAQPLLRLGLLGAALVVWGWTWTHSGWCAGTLAAVAALILGNEVILTTGWSSPAAPADDRGLRIYSQNVAMEPPDGFRGWLVEHRVDVVLLQEVYSGNRKAWEALAADLGFHSLYRALRSDAGMGGFILSRLPLKPLDPVTAPSGGQRTRYFSRARIQYAHRPVELYTVHLESLPIIKGERKLFGSSAYRLAQARILADSIAAAPCPVVLGGDLNAAPCYRSIRPLRRLLHDSWDQAGWGLGFTYPARFPLTRIDAVMHRGFHTEWARVVRVSGSDHRGVFVVLRLD